MNDYEAHLDDEEWDRNRTRRARYDECHDEARFVSMSHARRVQALKKLKELKQLKKE